ncbi:uncharacterized protein LOC134210240 [Armigeres subalbatus]|uniref:uncharacterized protein LOC134210240 n=1 Tax=Armigeres subalbatus TaxID=124917 RepID=UPI002ED26A65
MPTEKVLGMWWNTTTDTFTFKLSPKHDVELLSGVRMPTKREVLRTLMAIYDPVGLIANFLIYLKILLQEIWRAGCGWDDEISGKLAEKWLTWVEVLPRVHQVNIPRCYRIKTSANPTSNLELHIFCDASENGIAAVAYFRFEEKGKVECLLVGSKTRVSPLKFLSIPRLELQAAVIGSRLADCIVKSHRLKIMRCVFWTDSRDVVCWLRSDHRRYSQFVAFRPEEQWPVDSGNQGVTMEEIRPSILHHTAVAPLLVNFDRFSKWNRLLRTIGYVHRFVDNLCNRKKKVSMQQGPLTQEELSLAENTIYRLVQHQAYPDEIQLLHNSKPESHSWERILPKTSPLYKLSPTIDKQGVLRMQGRINACKWVQDSINIPSGMMTKSQIAVARGAPGNTSSIPLKVANVLQPILDLESFYVTPFSPDQNEVEIKHLKLFRLFCPTTEIGTVPAFGSAYHQGRKTTTSYTPRRIVESTLETPSMIGTVPPNAVIGVVAVLLSNLSMGFSSLLH